MEKRNIALIIALVMIAGAILYLEPLSPNKSFTGTTVAPGNRTEINQEKAKKYEYAKEIASPSGFVNVDNITIGGLIGKKVILVDFWTYSCINCIRTIPYNNLWYSKYHDKGLEIIGVHAPEFQFEHNIDNVRAAVTKFGIKYPVVLDNDFKTWGSYNNMYWPADYLIDIDGFIVDKHFGEGDYEATEKKIQDLLKERDEALGLNESIPDYSGAPTNAVTVDSSLVQSPETYFGAARNEYLGNGQKSMTGMQTLKRPDVPQLNVLYLDGDWGLADQYAESAGPASIIYKFSAKNVYFVASADNVTEVKVMLDGKPIIEGAGSDVEQGALQVKDERLYSVVEDSDYGTHILELTAAQPGLKAYTFTFG